MLPMFDWIDPQTKALLKDAGMAQLRLWLFGLAGSLSTYGICASSDQKTQFVTVSSGLIVGGATAFVSWWSRTGKAKAEARLVEMIAAAELKKQQLARAHQDATAAVATAKALQATNAPNAPAANS